MRTELKSHSHPDPFGQSASGRRRVDDEANSDLAGFFPWPVGLNAVRDLYRATAASARRSLGVVMVEIYQDRLSKEAHPLGAPQEGHGCAAPQEGHGCAALEEGHHEKPEEGYGRPAAQEIHPEGRKQQRQVRETVLYLVKCVITMFENIFMSYC